MYAQRTLEGISIHAPLRERQFNLGEGLTITDISIHAPSRERLRLTTGLFGVSTFQSTLPRGSDPRCHHLPGPNHISIHAPSRQRHDFNKLIGNANGISIHAPSRERRYFDISHNVVKPFQSTLPRGSDLAIICLDLRRWNFNPRSLAGATQMAVFFLPIFIISIHAPSRERHIGLIALLAYVLNFNPRSLAGATHGTQSRAADGRAFQSTLPRGSDYNKTKDKYVMNISIHAPSRERRFSVGV